MRIGVWALAVVGVAVVCGQGRAQSNLTTTPLGGPSPTTIQNVPINVSKLSVAPAMVPSTSNFSFAGFFRRFSIPGTTPTQGISPLPGPSSFPKYPSAKMIGTPPTLLGDPKSASPFQPMKPITMVVGQ
jgi:hypothetical protein